MTPAAAKAVIEEVQRARPGVARLARLVCLAVRVDAALLRRMRLRLAPELDVGTEADLWFSPLVESEGPAGFVLGKEVAAGLRQSLAAEPGLLAAVERWMAHERGAVAPSILLEERVTALALRGVPAAELEAALRPAVLALVDAARGPDVARWAMRALPRFPPAVLQTETAMMLALGASARLGDRRILPGTEREGALSPDLAWALPAERLAERVRLGLRLTSEGLGFFPPEENTALVLELPRTVPLWIELSWTSQGQDFLRTVPVEPGRIVPLPEATGNLTLRTLAGDRYTVEVSDSADGVSDPEGGGALFPARVFISSTGELAEFRAVVSRTLQQQGHEPVRMEALGDVDPGEAIARCDVFLTIVGWRAETAMGDDALRNRTAQEIEYELAAQQGKPRLIFLADASLSRIAEPTEAADDERMQAFRERLMSEAFVATFTSPEQLAGQVLHALDTSQRQTLESGLVSIGGPGPAARTGWLASGELVVTCATDLPPRDDEKFRAQALQVWQAEKMILASPACWDPVAGLLVLRLAEPHVSGRLLPLDPPDLREDSALVIATLAAKTLRILRARRELGGESSRILKLARPIPRTEAAGLAGSPALFRGSVMGTVLAHHPERGDSTVVEVVFADTRAITALLDEAARASDPAPTAEPVPVRVFVSYAHEDESYRAELEKYLVVLKLQGVIEHWDDRKLVAGDEWSQRTSQSLEEAHIIVLLVSPDFMASQYIQTKEMRRAMERVGAGEAVVVPVLVRMTNGWSEVHGLGSLQALPVKPGSQPEEIIPVKKWDDPDAAWESVIAGLRRTIEKFRTTLHTRSVPARPPGAASASAAGLQALRARLADPALGLDAVAGQLRADIAAARQHIAVVSDYMELHDALHNLHVQCYNFLLLESRRDDPATINWDGVLPAEGILGQIIATVATVAARASLPASETAFLDELKTAATELTAALEAYDAAPLKKATRRIERVHAIQPSRINLRFLDTARELPLEPLESGLKKILAQLNAADLASPEGQRFAAGVEALTRLRDDLPALCDEHNAWQEIDAEMRRIEAQIATDLGDLEFSWESLRKKIAALCQPEKGVWAAVLNEEIQKLDNALARGDAAKIAQAFRRCYSKAGARFHDVGFELKSLCDECQKVMDEILPALPPDSPDLQAPA